MRIVEAGLSLVVPDGWVSVGAQLPTGIVAAFVRAEHVGIPWAELSRVVMVTLEPGVRELDAWVTRAMAQNVRQGYPDLLATRVDGVPAVLSKWTDGVNDVASWFTIGGRGGVRFDGYSAVDFTGTTVGDADQMGELFIQSVVWD